MPDEGPVEDGAAEVSEPDEPVQNARPANEAKGARPSGTRTPEGQLALNRELLIELRRLNRALERFNRKRRYYTLSLTGGLARGFGTAIGATLIFALSLALLSQLFTVPVVGQYVKDVWVFVRQNSPAGSVMADPDATEAPETTKTESATPEETAVPEEAADPQTPE